MPAVNQRQRRLFGMVRAAQRGETPASPQVAKIAASISPVDAKKFAKTKEKNLPESAVPGKPAERLGAVTAIPEKERDAARQRLLAKTKEIRDKKKIKEELENLEEVEIEEGMSLKDFKANRRKLKRRESSADAKKRGHVGKEWYNSGRKYSPDEAKRSRANMDDEERRTRHRSAVDPDNEDDNNYSADKTKNPKKLRKQAAMGEEYIDETSLNRVRSKSEKGGMAIMSAQRGDKSKKENKARSKQLEKDVRGAGLPGPTKVSGRYTENPGTSQEKKVGEKSHVVSSGKMGKRKFKKAITKLGKKYNQDSVLIQKKPEGSAQLVGTNKSWPGEGKRVKVGKMNPGKTGEFDTKVKNKTFTYEEKMNEAGDWWHPDPKKDRAISGVGNKMRSREDMGQDTSTQTKPDYSKTLKPGETYMQFAKRKQSERSGK